jgi:predicted XRE-type DNA-binding protein
VVDIKIEKGSGNVFKDLGYANPEERLVKAELARLINTALKMKKTKEKWTQTKVAEIMGIPQSKVSLLSRGIVSGFSLSKLISFLSRLGYDINIVVNPKKYVRKSRGKFTGQVRVVEGGDL